MYVGWSCVCVVVLGLGPNPSCCLRVFGKGPVAVYQWILSRAVEEVIFSLVVSMKCEMRYFVTAYEVRFGIRFWIP